MPLGVMDSRGRSPLLLACSGAHTACAAQLGVQFPAIVNLADRDGMTPFHAACAAGDVELIDLLHLRGADMNTTATQWVAQCDLDSEEECDVVWCNVRLTPFAAAVMSGSKAAVERLLSVGVDDKTPAKCFLNHNCFCDFNYYYYYGLQFSAGPPPCGWHYQQAKAPPPLDSRQGARILSWRRAPTNTDWA